MQVYIAAKYRRRFDLREFAAALRAHGVEVTSRWLDNGEEEAGGPGLAALMDVEDVRRADAIVFIGEARGSQNTGGGRWFELGLAYALGKRCIVILDESAGDGEHLGSAPPRHETIFTCMPEIEIFDTQQQVLAELARAA